MFHQSSTKIALNLSGHNIYLKKMTSAKINTPRKPKTLWSGKINLHLNQKSAVDNTLSEIFFAVIKYCEN